jgi:hypothetical protein
MSDIPGFTMPRQLIRNGLVGWWPCKEASGATLYNKIGGTNNGTISGTPSWISGRSGPMLRLAGTQYADAGTGLTLTSAITMTMRFVSAGFGQNSILFAKQYFTGGDWRNYELSVGAGASYKLQFVYTAGSGVYNVWTSTSSCASLGLFSGIHTLGVSNTFGTGSSFRLYLDGVSVAGAWTLGSGNDAATSRNANERVVIGGTVNGTNIAVVDIDDLRLYSIYHSQSMHSAIAGGQG